MKRFVYLPILLAVFVCTCCNSNPPEKDELHHETLTVSDALFVNPERGLHKMFECNTTNPSALTPGQVKIYYNLGYTLVHFDFFMPDYRETLIEESYLQTVRESLQALREGGCKGVVRFAYTNSVNETPREAHEDLVLQHIAQLKPILQEYADVIFVMEAGFVGTWGEWYYTSGALTNFPANPTTKGDFESRRHVLDALLDALPQDRMICVRTPKFKMKCYDWGLKDTLTRAEAYTGTPKARLAAHDDAIMADANDLGTFTTEGRAYWEAETKYLIYGGESCPPGTQTSCDKTIDQFMKLHIGYLNKDYWIPAFNEWQTGGCLEQIKLGLGYRFEGRDIATTKHPKAGEELKVKLAVVNVGFSAPKNPRDIEFILINTADSKERYVVTPNADPRFWFTDEMHYVEASFQPKNTGTYMLYLNMPDPKANLRNDPRFSIRLANEDCWDAETGYNYLTTVTVE